MTARRAVEAYDRRLAKITESGDMRRLDYRDLGATVTVRDEIDAPEVTGTLLSFTHKLIPGLFGPTARISLTLCTSCPRCDTEPIEFDYPILESIKRTVKP